ncbi:hypothetical protein BJ166DRAFT_585360 [Pestalotiopsis sp. NC0098]|nr:hypothetical protein BJ166DRAFT_585360 [Pestalotiopsis sp. NC0098]
MTRRLVLPAEDMEIPDAFPNIFCMTTGQLEKLAQPMGIVVQKIGNSPYKAELIARIFMYWAELEPDSQTKYLGPMVVLCKGTQQGMLDFAKANDVPERQHPELKEHKSGTMQRILEHIRLVEADAPKTRSRNSLSTPSHAAQQRAGRLSTRAPTPSLSHRSQASTVKDTNRAKVLEALDTFVQSLSDALPSTTGRARRATRRPTPPSEANTSDVTTLIHNLEKELEQWEDDIYGDQRRLATEADRLENIKEIVQELFGDGTF